MKKGLIFRRSRQSPLRQFIVQDETGRLVRFLHFCKRANFVQARAIVDYRRLYGKLENLQQLRLDRDFTPEAIERLEPYVDFK